MMCTLGKHKEVIRPALEEGHCLAGGRIHTEIKECKPSSGKGDMKRVRKMCVFSLVRKPRRTNEGGGIEVGLDGGVGFG